MSGLNRLFPFAKKKPNIPVKFSDKIDSKSSKQKCIDDKNVLINKNLESLRWDILTENNEKAKFNLDKTCNNEISKKCLLETFKEDPSQDDDSEIKPLNKKSFTRKSSSVSEASIEGIKNYQRWNIPFSSKFKGQNFDKTLLTMQDLIYYNPVTNPIIKETKVEQKEDVEDDPDNDLLNFEPVSKI